MADWSFESIFHFTVNATNFERSLAFYQTLGFQLLRDNRDVVWPDYVAGNFGLAKAQGRGALLALGPEAAPHAPRPDRVARARLRPAARSARSPSACRASSRCARGT